MKPATNAFGAADSARKIAVDFLEQMACETSTWLDTMFLTNDKSVA
jgi:hypothetical protein